MNQMVADTGIGHKQELRATDMSAEAARNRYKVFREEVFASLSSIKDKFHFTFINADASPDVVKKVSISGPIMRWGTPFFVR